MPFTSLFGYLLDFNFSQKTGSNSPKGELRGLRMPSSVLATPPSEGKNRENAAELRMATSKKIFSYKNKNDLV